MWHQLGYALLALAVGREAARLGLLGRSFQQSVATADLLQAVKSMSRLVPADRHDAMLKAQLWSEINATLSDEEAFRQVCEAVAAYRQAVTAHG